MNINPYIKTLQDNRDHGGVGEHSHRLALQTLLKSAIPEAMTINEPSQLDCGAPDFVLTRNQIPFGYIETKDIGENLDNKANKEQLKGYTDALSNVLYTDYLEFRRFRDGEQVQAVVIGVMVNGKIKLKRENLADFGDMLETFAGYEGQTIITADDLAKRMASKARMLATEIKNALDQDKNSADEISAADNALTGQLVTFKKYLIHDLEPGDFADIYAQTVAYGMFAARLHDPTPRTFSRQEAAELIPTTNPFLRKFFQHIAGYELDERIHWIVDDLADLFRAADVGELMEDYRKDPQHNDPFLHFYETFLGEYNPKLRKSRGVYYTPEPVVNFIVRAVDEILCTEFKLPKGLADTGKTTIKADGGKKEVHKVQILDPATGTGTFLASIVQEIYTKYFVNQKGVWPDYVKRDLIPRLNGFEVLMASYAMAHIKLEMVLRDSGCKLGDDRLRIFLTNSLEEHDIDAGAMFTQWLSAEANEANFIKRDTPVMVVIGNPPYSIHSSNLDPNQRAMVEVYKFIEGKKIHENGALQLERNINDDYVKFIRLGEQYIDRNGEGILAYINNNGFLNNRTLRGMRWNLLQSFDKIYIIDLHGGFQKKATVPDGLTDENVFGIKQGVSINIFVKSGEKEKGELGKVFYYDIFGNREIKYDFLWKNELKDIDFVELNPRTEKYLFVPTNYELLTEYEKGFSVNEIFNQKGAGIITAHDKFVIDFDKRDSFEKFHSFKSSNGVAAELHQNFNVKRKKGWNILDGWQNLQNSQNINEFIYPITVRPFDIRCIFYEKKLVWGRSYPTMQHFIKGENVGLIFPRRSMEGGVPVFLAKNFIDKRGAHSWAETVGYLAPLYVYPTDEPQTITNKHPRSPNLDKAITQKIADSLAMRFTAEKQTDLKTFAPVDILDYIYAILHSPAYRQRYKEFLETDFPCVPYPADKKTFRRLVKLGGELRDLHLMESPALDKLITGYPEPGGSIVDKAIYKITDTKKRLGKVQINDKQYFQKVPELAWTFSIGGYRPAQKYLKDRKGRQLTPDDIIHYQKIIVALTETARLMEKIDEVDFIKKS